MEYKDLDKHFTAPIKFLTESNFNCKRVPRKFKKRHSQFFRRHNNIDLNQALWLLRWRTNPNYNRFLIKKICEHYNKNEKILK